MRLLPIWLAACLCLAIDLAFASSFASKVRSAWPPFSPFDSVITGAKSGSQRIDQALQVLDNRYTLLNKLVERQTEKLLRRMQRKELALQAQLKGKDSLKAQALFAQSQADYNRLLIKLQMGDSVVPTAHPLQEYIPRIDSMQTALRFLGQSNLSALPASQKLQQLQTTLQNANDIQAFIRQREQQLQDQLANSGVAGKLLAINKEAYYYQAQLLYYKDLLKSPDKIGAAVWSAAQQSSVFQRFWQQNSYFSRLFPSPAPGVAGTPQELLGLQTRDQLQKEVQNRLGINAQSTAAQAAEQAGHSGGGGGLAYLQGQMQQMQTKLQQIKSTLQQYNTGSATGVSGGQLTMPQFQPNSQHNKTFLKRLQYNLVVQNNPSTGLLPAISSMGINIGYKLSDKITVGVGGSYLLGLGYDLSHVRLTSQGIEIRSFLDIHAKGSIWITGGFEYNYMQQFYSLKDIPNVNVWQRSALLGVSKKYRIGKRENAMQLLYDLLAHTEIPNGQSFQFRLGFGF